MKFVVGIGNPGRKYEGTRHNIGSRVLGVMRPRLDAAVKDVRLVDPGTYVNNTGDAVGELVSRFGAKPADLLIVCDDVNLVFGKLRFRASGSAGGHHGLESVIQALGSEDFARVRIGVGNETMPKDDLAPYVLEKFSRDEEKELPEILEKASKVCESWIREGADGALSCLSRLQSNQQEKS